MKKTTLLLTTISAAAMGLIPLSSAMAAAPTGVAGNIDLNYANLSDSGDSVNSWGGDGALAFGLGMSNLGAQVNGSYADWTSNQFSGSATNWGIGGSLFWAPAMGRFGVTVAYQSISFSDENSNAGGNATTYGGFAEWYAGDIFTLGAKVGGASLSGTLSGCGGEGSCSGSRSGWYIGGGATAYLMPDLALSASVDYVGVSQVSETTFGVGLEWLVSESTPISVFGGYKDISPSVDGESGIPSISEWLVGVKFYFNGDNSMTLRDRQRNGASGWAAEAPTIIEE